MQAQIYWMPSEYPGRIGITPRPRGGDWLEDEVLAWRRAGVHMIVSMLETYEEKELDLMEEETLCQQYKLHFRSFPVPDRGVPSSHAEINGLIQEIVEALEDGQNVAVHCRQGIGRSSLIVATTLVSVGLLAEEAWDTVEAARKRPVPDTEEQRQWLVGWSLRKHGG